MTVIKLLVILGKAQPPSDVTYICTGKFSLEPGNKGAPLWWLDEEVYGGKHGDHGVLKLGEGVCQLCDLLDRIAPRVHSPLLLSHWTLMSEMAMSTVGSTG
jgi:hypothetical protein